MPDDLAQLDGDWRQERATVDKLTVLPELYEYGERVLTLPKEPLLITVCTATPVILKDPLPFDSLLARGMVYDVMKDRVMANKPDPYWLPLPLELDCKVGTLPIWKATDFFPVESHVFSTNVHRRAQDNPYAIPAAQATIGQKKLRRQPPTGRGQFMVSRNPQRRIVAQQWEVTCVGNLAEIKRLLGYINWLGSRSNMGGGRVVDWHVESLQREFSFFDKDRYCLRAMPLSLAAKPDYLSQGGIAMQGWTPPYWRSDLWMPCINSIARRFLI